MVQCQDRNPILKSIKMRFEKLPISAIASCGEVFRISYGSPSRELEESVKRTNILNPVWARDVPESVGNFQLVLGYSRFLAAQKNNISPVPCLVINGDTSDHDLLLANIYDNLSHRELNPVEKALALKKSLNMLGEDRTIGEIMPALGFGPSGEIMHKMIRILDLESGILSFIAKGSIPPSNAYALLNFEKDEQHSVFDIIQTLKLGVNLQKEFMENLFECSRREGISAGKLLERANFQTILGDSKKPEHARAETMRRELRRMRYPHLSEMEESFDECIRSMKPAPQVRILPPPFFETGDFSLSVRFQTPGELLKHLEKISAAIRSPQVMSWFKTHSIKCGLKSD
jgi:ParB/RepB/Spo0J family partition protein